MGRGPLRMVILPVMPRGDSIQYRTAGFAQIGRNDWNPVGSRSRFVTSLIDEKKERFWDFQDRDRVRRDYQSGLRGKKLLSGDYFLLKGLRNALAHGTRPDDSKIRHKVESALSDPKLLQEELRRLIKKLLPR